jgi:hypothetical protein
VSSASGKALLRKRGEPLERGFCHVLDHGGLRRATLRGTEKLSKRLILAAMTHNLSLLLRQQTGIGTAKQALAAAMTFVLRLWAVFGAWLLDVMRSPPPHWQRLAKHHGLRAENTPRLLSSLNTRFSTGC